MLVHRKMIILMLLKRSFCFCLLAALSSPIGVFFPHVFPVGAKYTVQCWTPQIGYTNTTLSVYDRLLPIRPGKESFEYISSRALTPGEWGAEITRTNAGETYEYQCEMEVFINGRTLRSRSDPVTAKPGNDESPNRTPIQCHTLMYF